MKLLARAFQKRSLDLVLRSNKVNKGQKRAEKGQIPNFIKSKQIIRQNEALDGSFREKLISWSKKVIIGHQRSSKIAKEPRDLGQPITSSEARCSRNLDQPITSSEAIG